LSAEHNRTFVPLLETVFRTEIGLAKSMKCWLALPMLMAGLLPWHCAAAPPEAVPRVQMTNVTTAAGIDFVETIGDHQMTNIVEATGVGCAFVDYDQDGLLDLYFVNGCWLRELSNPKIDRIERARLADATDRLYRNCGDGTFVDVTVKAGLNQGGYGMGIVVSDYDGDGDSDLYVTNFGPNFLYQNNGDGTFTETAAAAGVDMPDYSVGSVFFDYDHDNRLDLFVGNYLKYDSRIELKQDAAGFPGPQAYSGQRDRLFRGRSDGTFSEVTELANIKTRSPGRAMGVNAFDSNNDGWTDVFVANDMMDNFLFHNRGNNTFVNSALEAGVAFGMAGQATSAMAAEVADIDGDGYFDLFVPDMKKSCLYHNGPNGFFDESLSSGIAIGCSPYHSWGAAFGDFDLDGNLDLYVSNGAVHGLEAQPDLLFVGDGNGGFQMVRFVASDQEHPSYVSRGVAAGDFDNDGDIDLLVASLNGQPVLWRNDTPRRGRHWLGINLLGRPPNRDAIGAIVKVTVNGKTMFRHRSSGHSYLSHHDHRLHFGLGSHNQAERVTVTWPDGSQHTLSGVAADQWLILQQTSKE
jgi:enediyne biosynthesis protein E4